MAETPTRILLIDDDRKLARLLIEFLRAQGMQAEAVHDGREGVQRAATGGWDLVLLDVMLPTLDGFQVLKLLRASSNVPVLMLTARGGEDDRIAGLEGGADDYLPKTSSTRELIARIRSLLRRTATTAPAASTGTAIRVGDLVVDPSARTARLGESKLSLTPVEFDLLTTLARNAGNACSRDRLLEQVRDRDFDGLDRSIDVHIAALRRKLGDDPKAPQRIRTVRTIGYRLVDPRVDDA